MSGAGRKLFSGLCRAHRLTRRQRKICRRLTSLYGLDGRDGPGSAPATIFFLPSYWERFTRDARRGRSAVPAEEVEELAGKLFPDGGEMPTDW